MRRVDHAGTNSGERQNCAITVGDDQIADDVVGVLGSDAARTEYGIRKVLQVGRDDDMRLAMQRGRKHEPAVWFGQHQTGYSALVAGHHRI